MTLTAASVMPDLESSGDGCRGERMLRLRFDMRPQMAIADRLQECGKLFRTLGARLHFDATIRKVSHPADHVEALCDLFHGIPKADALHMSFVENLSRC